MVFLYFYYTSHTMEMDISKILPLFQSKKEKAPALLPKGAPPSCRPCKKKKGNCRLRRRT